MLRAFRRWTIVSASGAFWAGFKTHLLDDKAGAERRHVFAERFEIGRVETAGETESVDGDGSRGTHVAKHAEGYSRNYGVDRAFTARQDELKRVGRIREVQSRCVVHDQAESPLTDPVGKGPPNRLDAQFHGVGLALQSPARK